LLFGHFFSCRGQRQTVVQLGRRLKTLVPVPVLVAILMTLQPVFLAVVAVLAVLVIVEPVAAVAVAEQELRMQQPVVAV
jgi:hypothetical protein